MLYKYLIIPAVCMRATLNGKEWNNPWFSWDDIKEGGVLVLERGSKPNYKWGSDPADTSPSKL